MIYALLISFVWFAPDLMCFPYFTRFISLVQKRHEALRKEHDQMAAALQTIERGTLLAEQLKTQLRHEKMVLEQKKEVQRKLFIPCTE